MKWFGVKNARLRYYVCVTSNRHLCGIDDLLDCIQTYSCRMCTDLFWLILMDKGSRVYTFTDKGEICPVSIYSDPMKLRCVEIVEIKKLIL